jgi:hypothetical protein
MDTKQLQFDGYSYTLDTISSNNTKRFRCKKRRSKGCKAFISILENGELDQNRSSPIHNHDEAAQPAAIRDYVEIMKNNVVALSKNMNLSVEEIWDLANDSAREQNVGTPYAGMEKGQVRNLVQRERQKASGGNILLAATSALRKETYIAMKS